MNVRQKFSFFCFFIILIFSTSFPASADEAIAGGSFGEGLIWELSSDGVLTVSGSGEMCGVSPWAEFTDMVESVYIADDVTLIVDSMFSGIDAVFSCRCTARHISGNDFFIEWEYRHGNDFPEPVISAATCTTGGYTEHQCADCLTIYRDSYTAPLGHDAAVDPAIPPGCTEPGCTDGAHCTRCGQILKEQMSIEAAGHIMVKDDAVSPTCTDPGLTEGSHCAVCGITFISQEILPAVGHSFHDGACSVCGASDPDYRPGCRVFFSADEISGIRAESTVEIDGRPYVLNSDMSVVLISEAADIAVLYTYNSSDADLHKVYPSGMYVWFLERSGTDYYAKRIPALDGVLQYSGSSIRITGKKGIRMISSVPTALKASLTAEGIDGWKLYEYGTLAAWASELGNTPLTPDFASVKSAYAYRCGEADPIYAEKGGLTQYTNVLVGFSEEQCVPDLVMRSYAVLENSAGKRIYLLGGTIHRSIGYIAWQNRSSFAPGTESYEYIWSIIHYVFGDKYDSEYRRQ